MEAFCYAVAVREDDPTALYNHITGASFARILRCQDFQSGFTYPMMVPYYLEAYVLFGLSLRHAAGKHAKIA